MQKYTLTQSQQKPSVGGNDGEDEEEEREGGGR